MAAGKKQELEDRIQMFELTRGVARAIAIDAGGPDGKNAETFERTSTPFSGIPEMLDRMMQRLCAAGNMPVNTPTYPGAIPGVHDVTALAQPGQLAGSANFSPQVSMALPGASVVYVGSQAYVVQGTSPATAYASGIAAGTKSVDCSSWQEIISALQAKFPVPGR